MRTYYEILGVGKNALGIQIIQAFRKLAKELHPDKEGGDGEKMRELNEAYDVLSDDAKRAEYDLSGCDAVKMGRRGRVEETAKDLFVHYVTARTRPADMLPAMKLHVIKWRAEEMEKVRRLKRDIVEMREYLDAARAYKEGALEIFRLTVEGLIADMERQQANAERKIEEGADVLELLKGYVYAGTEDQGGAHGVTASDVGRLLRGERMTVA